MNLRIGETSWDNNIDSTQVKVKNGVIKASELNIIGQENDELLQKKKKAGQDAIDIVKSVFERQSEDDDEIAARHSDIDSQKSKKLDAVTQMKEFTDAKEGMSDKYGFTDEQLEQINLFKSGEFEQANLSDEQMAYIEEESMYDDGIGKCQELIDACDQRISQDQGTIKGIHDARLKEHDMVNANKAADAINAQASKEFINGMIKQAVEEVDAKAEETQKTEEEKKAEETEEEAKEEKDQDVKTEDMSSSTLNTENVMAQIHKAVNDIAASHNLTAEELKGIQVDEIL